MSTEFLSDEQKQELARLAEAATPTPWIGANWRELAGDREWRAPNGRYIVGSCNAVPALLAEIAELRDIVGGMDRLTQNYQTLQKALAIAREALEQIREITAPLLMPTPLEEEIESIACAALRKLTP